MFQRLAAETSPCRLLPAPTCKHRDIEREKEHINRGSGHGNVGGGWRGNKKQEEQLNDDKRSREAERRCGAALRFHEPRK